MSCGVGPRCGLDPALLWLWCRSAAIAPFRLLAWEPPYAVGAALEKDKQNKTKQWRWRMHFQDASVVAGKLMPTDGRGPQSLTTRTSPLSCWTIPTMAAVSPQSKRQDWLRRASRRSHTHTPSFLQHPTGYAGQPSPVWEGTTEGAVGPESWEPASPMKYF